MDDTVTNPIRVLLVDDHPLTLAGAHAALDTAPDIDIVGEAVTGAETEALVAELRPDVLVLDLMLPDRLPLEIERWVRQHYPETVTLILTAHDRDAYLAEVVKAGVAGFLTKDEPPPHLIAAIRAAARGEVLLTPEQWARIRAWEEGVGARWDSLTEREQEIVQQVADSQTNHQIAEALGISEHTVETHVSNILRKLALTTRTEVAVWLWKHGLVEEQAGPGRSDQKK